VRQRAPSRLRSDPWLDRVSYAWCTAENKTLLLAILYSDSTKKGMSQEAPPVRINPPSKGDLTLASM